uniref:Uncharacterized protein n=1 Tax=Caenorhabditis tropicalis TaxID=1561998 RepID=A0A1I7TZP1_9PELO
MDPAAEQTLDILTQGSVIFIALLIAMSVVFVAYRIICLSIIALVETWIVIRITGIEEETAPYITTIIVLAIIGFGAIYATWIEIRCAHFVKRSRETGFSISVARPVGPATISLSDNPPHADPQPLARRLPPLRHTNRNQYVVNESDPPGPGNPNEGNILLANAA